MTNAQRIFKQIFILLVFLAIFGGLGILSYSKFKSSDVPLVTNFQARDIIIAQTELISVNAEQNDYDFWAKITNPNTDYGSSNINYQIYFIDSLGRVVSQRNGTSYILPGETKSIIESPLRFSEPISRVEMKVSTSDWQKPNIIFSNLHLVARNWSYLPNPQPGIAASITGQIFNNSDFDLRAVDVLVTVRDSSGGVVGVSKTNINDLSSRNTKIFKVSWPLPLTPNNDSSGLSIGVEAYTNIFSN